MTKRFISLMLTLTLIITAAPLAVAQEASEAKAPRLTLTEPLKDFGTVPKGTKIDWSFEVKNTGTSTLEITNVKPACGCTVAEFDKTIEPGKTGKVVAHVDTTTFTGPISKGITIQTNDPSAPSAQVTINAIVKPFVDLYPAGFLRYNMVQGEVSKQSILLYSEEEEPFEILKIGTPQDWISVDTKKAVGDDVRKVGRPGQTQYVLDVTVGGPEARIGPIAEKIHVVTNSKHQPEVWLTVSGVVRPSYRVEPSGVNFGEVAPSEAAAKRTVTIKSNSLKDPGAFLVTKAESGVAGVTTAFKPTGKPGEFELTLEVTKDAKPGTIDGAVTVHTSDSARPTVMIPVKGAVKVAAAASAGAK